MNTIVSILSVMTGNFLYALTVKLFLLPAGLVKAELPELR